MNPHKMNKVDVSAMNEQELKAFKLYGKVPAKNILTKMQKDRKYFDSGDYMMSKAGVNQAQPVGTAIPTPEGLPHASPPQNGNLGSSPNTNQGIPFPMANMDRRPSAALVGVGISPAATSEAMAVPSGNHQRRPSESLRISPPGTFREPQPPSSYPIHHGSLSSSPIKTSALARRADEEMEV